MMIRIGGIILVLMLMAPHAYAQSLCSNSGTPGYLDTPAPGADVTSDLGPRNLARSPDHKGTDYRLREGTRLQGPPAGCKIVNGPPLPFNEGGWGYYATFDCGVNDAGQTIRLNYGHLLSANSYSPASNTITTGNTGSSTGPHLDYVINIDGTPVDAQCATGIVAGGSYTYVPPGPNIPCPINGQINLCDPAVTEKLLEHGIAKRGGKSNGSNLGSAGPSAPPQPPNGTTSGGGSTGTGGSGTVGTGTGSGGTGGTSGGSTAPPFDPGLLTYDPQTPYVAPDSTPDSCFNSTCITTSMIVKAQNNNVDIDDTVPRIEFIDGTCADNPEPTKTGLVNLVRDGRQLKEEDDQFCITQGCSYIRGEGCK